MFHFGSGIPEVGRGEEQEIMTNVEAFEQLWLKISNFSGCIHATQVP